MCAYNVCILITLHLEPINFTLYQKNGFYLLTKSSSLVNEGKSSSGIIHSFTVIYCGLSSSGLPISLSI